MNKDNYEYKVGSISLIIILVCSGILIIMPSSPVIHTASAVSTWTQTSDIDFLNGTFNNITMIGSGEATELKIDLSDLDYWTKKTPTGTPGARGVLAGATIYGDDKIVIYGGFIPSKTKNDTWEYDYSDNKWTDKTKTTNKPFDRFVPRMASIWGTKKAILFSGLFFPNHLLNDTWEYNSSTGSWVNKTKLFRPPSRYSTALASIFGHDKVLLFGGATNTPEPNFNDTWVYDSSTGTWTEKQISPPATKPSIRDGHAMAAVDGDDKVVLFGGSITTDLVNDTWVYDYSQNTWTEKTPVGGIKPTRRYGHAMATIYGDDKVVLFGGRGLNNGTHY